MKNDDLIAIVEECSAAIAELVPAVSRASLDRLTAANHALLTALLEQTAAQSATTVALLIERTELLQRHIEQLDRRLDEWDGSRSRAVGE